MDEPLTLQDVARNVLERHDVSGRQLQNLAQARGLTITYTTINHMAAGTYASKPKMETLDALAALSDYSVEQVYAAARQPAPKVLLRDRLPRSADTLSSHQIEAILTLVRLFVRQNEEYEAAMENARRLGREAAMRHRGQLELTESPADPSGRHDREGGTESPVPKAARKTPPRERAERAERRRQAQELGEESQVDPDEDEDGA